MRLHYDDGTSLYINGEPYLSFYGQDKAGDKFFSYDFTANQQYEVLIHWREDSGDGTCMLFWNIGSGMVPIAKEYFQYKEDYADVKHIFVTCQEGYKEVSGGSQPDRCDPL